MPAEKTMRAQARPAERKTHMSTGITRRQAITAAGISAAALGTIGTGLAAAEEAVALEEAAVTTEALPVEYIERDVVIVGGGSGGICCALSALDHGVGSVLLLEKNVTIGGNSAISHGSITIPGVLEEARADATEMYDGIVQEIINEGPQTPSEEKYWDQLLAEYAEWQAGDQSLIFDTPLFTAIQYSRWDEVEVDFELYLYERTGDFLEWFQGLTGAHFKKSYGGSGYSYPRTTTLEGYSHGDGWFYTIMPLLEANEGFELRESTPVEELLVDGDGNVIGVRATAADGHAVMAYARKGVVLATGGFTANRAMLQQYNTMWPFAWAQVIPTDGSACLTGDGVLMSQAIGAGVGTMGMMQTLAQCDSKTGAESTLVGDRLLNLLRVNYQGQRFIAEDASRNEMSRAILAMPEAACLIISDANTSLNLADGEFTQNGVPTQMLIDLGTLFVADTIEELGAAFGADPAVFADTVQRYNGYCDTGVDEEFGGKQLQPACKVLVPPFYAYSVAPAVHITYGGVHAEHEAFHALKYDNETPIGGLHVIGDAREGAAGVDAALPDGFIVGKYLAAAEAQDRTEAIEAAKTAEQAAAAAAAEKAAKDAEPAPVYADGTYVGTGYGMGGEINVTVEVSDGVVAVTDISPNNETRFVAGHECIENGTYARMIEDAQSADIDVIAGATLTSTGIITAATDALAQALA